MAIAATSAVTGEILKSFGREGLTACHAGHHGVSGRRGWNNADVKKTAR
jgi:hypothetical protein